ncbi:MAG: NADH-quinone oxidoreductase subunit C [Nitrospirota bacterium]
MKSLQALLQELLRTDEAGAPGSYPTSVPLYPVTDKQFKEAARALQLAGARLAGEWATDETRYRRGFGVFACYNRNAEYLLVKLQLHEEHPTFPSLTRKFPAAWRFERQIHSFMGIVPAGHPDLRPWIKHEDWPQGAWPLRKTFDPARPMPRVPGDYQWRRVEGDGVHEIPVGPVHAGIIEPGHFRFQVVGEDILHLEEKLGYVHKGIEKRFEALSWAEGARLAGRISGDSTVAHALAYSQAVESMTECTPPDRALWLRAVMLERERIANHLGDLGAIANDAALSFLFYQFMALREQMLRTNHGLFGHRLLMDGIRPGGVAADLPPDGAQRILDEMNGLLDRFEGLVTIYDENASLDGRLRGTGILTPEQAGELGVVGLVARASGQRLDCRIQHPRPPYDRVVPEVVVLNTGDVHARGWVRIEEVRESVRLIRRLLASLPSGETAIPWTPPAPDRTGFSAVEGWRGEILCWLQSGPEREINRCMVRDPSGVNWLGLERAILGNIVPEFPLCNKSFNQSYSGHDL